MNGVLTLSRTANRAASTAPSAARREHLCPDPPARRPLVRGLMLRLVGAGEGDAPVRAVRRSPTTSSGTKRSPTCSRRWPTAAWSLFDGFVEVAHEALLREGTRLREWIDEDAAGRRLRRHLTARIESGPRPGATKPSFTAAPASPSRSTGAASTRST